MAKICLSLTAKTIARDLEILEKYRSFVDMAELRVDCLDQDERFFIRRFPELAGIPVILSVRRSVDGGEFIKGEGARIVLFSKGLAFAEVDQRRNFAYLDLEEDIDAPGLLEVSRAFGIRIIHSYYNLNGVDDNLAGKIRGLRKVGDEIAKVVVSPRSLEDMGKVYRAAADTRDVEKIIVCRGDFGANTQILAERMGSHLSYTCIKGESDVTSIPDVQFDPKELAETYRFRTITKNTKVFAVTGFPLRVVISPWFYNRVFAIEDIDAVYLPIPADSFESMVHLADDIGIAGISVTVPYKEAVIPYLSWESQRVKMTGACNTLIAGEQGWMGYNTDARGFAGSILSFTGLKNLRGKKITIVGTGGAARAVAVVVSQLLGRALILNRTVVKARALAAQYGFAWGGLDAAGFKLMKKYNDIIIQATPVGMEGRPDEDPLDFYQFTGKEQIMDLIYQPEKTRCLRRAEEAGCKIINGSDMLLRQARYQYRYFIGKEFPPSLVDRVGLNEIA